MAWEIYTPKFGETNMVFPWFSHVIPFKNNITKASKPAGTQYRAPWRLGPRNLFLVHGPPSDIVKTGISERPAWDHQLCASKVKFCDVF